MSRWSNGADPNFDLVLRDPDGAIVASSAGQARQEQLGARVTRTGTYAFEVRSVAGSGPYVLDVSGASRVTESPVAAAPGAPRNVLAVGGNERAAVSWAAPDSDGGSPITNYIVTPYIGTNAQTPTTVGNVTETVIKGLTNGTTYTFRVGARNAVGDGPESAASSSVTPQRGRRP